MGMTSLEGIISKLREAQPGLAEKYGVSKLWVFGSWTTGTEQEGSDVDLLVEFSRRGFTLFDFAQLCLDLEALLGLEVDLVERDALRLELRESVLPNAVAV